MPRKPNTRSTLIYWLVDTRSETIAAGWPSGKPFYCGKTVSDVDRRLNSHFSTVRKWPKRKLSLALSEVGRAAIVRVMEIVPFDADWCERERSWIKTLRGVNPDCANTADGGEGAAGYIPSAEHRAKLRAASTGRKKSAETLAKLRRPRRPKAWVFTSEHREKLREANKSPKALEARAKLHASLKGRKFSDAHRANMSAARKKSPKAMAVALANLQAIKLRGQQDVRGLEAIVACHGPYVFRRCDQERFLPHGFKRRLQQMKSTPSIPAPPY